MSEAGNTPDLTLAREALTLPEPERGQWLLDLARRDPDAERRVRAFITQLGDETRADEHQTERVAAPRQIGNFSILALLGEGGMGTVYLARQHHPQREVALKVIRGSGGSREALLRFEREAETLARLEHPCIARVYEAGTVEAPGGELPWLAMEYVRGEDLATHAAALSLTQKLALLIELADAVHYAHSRGVIHRDLKPANILVDADGHPRILDFGVARLQDQQTTMTQAGQVLGTVPYMSPEQLAGDARAADVPSDVYALGVIAYQLLSGAMPYPSISNCSLLEAIDCVRQQPPVPLGRAQAALRGDIETVVMKALSAEAAQRYVSAAALGDDLRCVLECRPIRARPPTLGYLALRFAQRNRVLVASIALVFVALLVATVVSLSFAWSEAAARAEAEARAAEAAAVSGFLENMLTSADPDKALGRDIRVNEVLVAAAAELRSDSSLPALVRARILSVLGGVYYQLGDTAAAEPLLRQAQSLAEARSALLDDIDLRLAETLGLSGQPGAAEDLLLSLLQRDTAAELAIRAQSLLAQSRFEQGQADVAEQAFRDLLTQAQAELPPGHPLRVTIKHNLTAVLQQQARFDEALAMNAEVVAQRSESLGAEHPQTLFARNLRAILLFRVGEAEQAINALREVVEARRRVLGEVHPSTWISSQSLGAALVGAGQSEEGAALIAEALVFIDARFGRQHPLALVGRDNLAQAYERMGRLDEAEALFGEIVALHETHGEVGNELLVARNNLAMLLFDQARHAEALAQFDLLMEQVDEVFAADHPYSAIFRGNRGQCLAELGRDPEAAEELERSLGVLEARLGAEHARTLKVAAQLAAVRGRLP